jgi:hypothetical protein
MLDIIAILYRLFDQSIKQKVATKFYYTINDVLFDSVSSSAVVDAYSGFFSVCGDRHRNWGRRDADLGLPGRPHHPVYVSTNKFLRFSSTFYR